MARALAVVATFALVACASRPIPCATRDDCPPGACCRPNAAGELFCSNNCPCVGDADCPLGFCVPDASGERVCMAACPESRRTTCFDGSLCAEFTETRRVCWTGGTVRVGDACTSLVECERGAICVGTVGLPGATCSHACEYRPPGEPQVDSCPDDATCTSTTVGLGFCPIPA